ncbi:hypothetical protein ACOMHN_042524 [Nucella lapillus]
MISSQAVLSQMTSSQAVLSHLSQIMSHHPRQIKSSQTARSVRIWRHRSVPHHLDCGAARLGLKGRGQKSVTNQAERMVKRSRIELQAGNIGDNVALPVPMVDRGRGDPRNILGIIIDKNENDLYTIATRQDAFRFFASSSASPKKGLPVRRRRAASSVCERCLNETDRVYVIRASASFTVATQTAATSVGARGKDATTQTDESSFTTCRQSTLTLGEQEDTTVYASCQSNPSTPGVAHPAMDADPLQSMGSDEVFEQTQAGDPHPPTLHALQQVTHTTQPPHTSPQPGPSRLPWQQPLLYPIAGPSKPFVSLSFPSASFSFLAAGIHDQPASSTPVSQQTGAIPPLPGVSTIVGSTYVVLETREERRGRRGGGRRGGRRRL